MDPNTAVTATIIICLLLIIGVFFLGLTMGRTLCAVVAKPSGQTFRGTAPGRKM